MFTWNTPREGNTERFSPELQAKRSQQECPEQDLICIESLWI